jgi:uncharacterized protein DUF3604
MVGASGLASVWARENTREALWDAMARKETYATTGTRIRVRVFGGFDFVADDLYRSDFAKHGYATGVPMGGDLRTAPAGKAPAFIIQALRDPDGANLDRLQIIKGWLDAGGKTHERIWDIAVSDGRQIDKEGRCQQPVGNTVNWQRRPTRMPSAMPCWAATGATRHSIQPRKPSITSACWKFRRRAGPRTMQSFSG